MPGVMPRVMPAHSATSPVSVTPSSWMYRERNGITSVKPVKPTKVAATTAIWLCRQFGFRGFTVEPGTSEPSEPMEPSEPPEPYLELLRQVEKRGDLHLGPERDRKVDEPFDLERRGGEVNHSVSPWQDVEVSRRAATVICQDDPFVLARTQVVFYELLNELVGEVLQDVFGYEQIRSGQVLGDVANLKPDLAFLVFLADGLDDIRGDINPEVARIAPVHRTREAPVPAARIDDRLDGVLPHEVFKVSAILPRDLQGRSRAARSSACDVLAPAPFCIDAVEGVRQW